MAPTARSRTLVSAPGKVLLAGGYLVLDPAYPGIVVATSSRFYTVVQSPLSQSAPAPPSSSAAGAQGAHVIRVRSHQFVGAEWVYIARASADGGAGAGGFTLTQSKDTAEAKDAGRNPFVGLALLYALKVAAERTSTDEVERRLASGLDIFVLGDNDFYSQRETLKEAGSDDLKAPTTPALRSIPPFAKQQCPIREVHKTGLGSSAAMTTSLVGAMLVHLGAVTPKSAGVDLSRADKALVHNVAQLAHCAAQGKVGSGFDVSAAVWGSQVYRRFEPSVLDGLMGGRVGVEGEDDSSTATLPPLLDALSPTNPQWRPSPKTSQSTSGHPTAAEGLAELAAKATISDNDPATVLPSALSSIAASQSGPATETTDVDSNIFRPAPIALPPFISLVLADVDAGSNTPSLVGKVLQWRKDKPEWATQLYSILASANQYLADCLVTLTLAHSQDPKAYEAVAEWAATVPSAKWENELKTTSEGSHLDKSVLQRFVDLRKALRSVRGGMRELGVQAGCPVEPDEMGKLISASVDGAPGVAGGGVPGAGGWDALYLVHVVPPSLLAKEDLSKESARRDAAAEASPARRGVEQIWAGWESMSVGPLLSTAAGAGAGLRVLELDNVPGLQDALDGWLE